MKTTTTTSSVLNKRVTVWVFHKRAREAELNIDLEWAKRGSSEFRSFVPVAINIHPNDVDITIAKWEAITGEIGVCRVAV